MPVYPVDVVSTLGAGDVFHGALLAARIRGLALTQCAAYACITAALSCRGLDGRTAIPGRNRVMAGLPAFLAETQQEIPA